MNKTLSLPWRKLNSLLPAKYSQHFDLYCPQTHIPIEKSLSYVKQELCGFPT